MRIAVFIDAENIGSELVPQMRERLRLHGAIHFLRAIGNFSAPHLAAWLAAARDHGIDLDFQPSTGAGKNASDIALAVEATTAALSGRFDCIAIVSRDADFTPLAMRLRRLGLSVLGLAPAENCSQAFQQACTAFLPLVIAPSAPAAALAKPNGSKPAGSGAQHPLGAALRGALDADGTLNLARLGSLLHADPALRDFARKGKLKQTLLAKGIIKLGKEDTIELAPSGPYLVAAAF